MNEEKDSKPVLVKPLTRLQRIGIAVLVVLGGLLVGGTIFVWSGIYNISARADHWTITDFIIATTRDQSIKGAADNIEVPDLNDPNLVALGREHVRGACIDCHGAPGEQNNPVYDHMLPDPPDLMYAAEDYEPGELFWIVHNGMKYTGMPAWPAEDREDEVWSVVAFLLELNARGTEVFRPELEGQAAPGDITGQAVAPLENCARCHGDDEEAPVSTFIPVLHGQSEEYLIRALEEYRSGIRQSGFMVPVAHEMTVEEISATVRYYAQLSPPDRNPLPDDPAITRGAEIALEGLPDADVPACISCHGGRNPDFPLLAGQPADYLAEQLRLWQRDGRSLSGYGEIMAAVAERLSEEDIEAVSKYFASLAAGEAQ